MSTGQDVELADGWDNDLVGHLSDERCDIVWFVIWL